MNHKQSWVKHNLQTVLSDGFELPEVGRLCVFILTLKIVTDKTSINQLQRFLLKLALEYLLTVGLCFLCQLYGLLENAIHWV